MKKSVLIFAFIAAFLTGCSKSDELSSDLEVQGIAAVAVFNGLSRTTSLEVYVDGSKLSVGKIEHFHNWLPGRREVTIVARDGNHKDEFKGTVNLDMGRYYSLFVHKDSRLRITQIEDDPVRPKPGLAKIRVAHMSSHVASFDMGADKNSTLDATQVRYKDITTFATVPVGKQIISGKVKDTASTGLRDFEYEFAPKSQGVYTLIIRDHSNPMDPTDRYFVDLIEH